MPARATKTCWQRRSYRHRKLPLTNASRPKEVHISTYVAIGDGITAPGAGTGEARIYVDTADGDLKVVFADGTVKTIVVDT